jgi:hypothetical protein
MDSKEFTQRLRTLLEETNINFGRKSSRRETFITSIVELAETFCGMKKPSPPKMKKKFLAMEGKALSVKPKNDRLRIKKDSFAMTQSESMKRDDELKGLGS